MGKPFGELLWVWWTDGGETVGKGWNFHILFLGYEENRSKF